MDMIMDMDFSLLGLEINMDIRVVSLVLMGLGFGIILWLAVIGSEIGAWFSRRRHERAMWGRIDKHLASRSSSAMYSLGKDRSTF